MREVMRTDCSDATKREALQYLSLVVVVCAAAAAFACSALRLWVKGSRARVRPDVDGEHARGRHAREQMDQDELLRLKKRLDLAEAERDQARQDALRYQHEAHVAREEGGRLAMEVAAERSDARCSPLRGMCTEIDEKVVSLAELPQAQRRKTLKRLKAQYHPDYQRVTSSSELSKLYTHLSQHVNRYCDEHLQRDCAVCAERAMEVW